MLGRSREVFESRAVTNISALEFKLLTLSNFDSLLCPYRTYFQNASSEARITEGMVSSFPRLLFSLMHLQYMEKRLFVQLNGNRKVLGILRGYDVLS